MKELIIFSFIIISFTQSCSASKQNDIISDYEVARTIKLEENDSSFISNLSNIDVFSNSNILINSAGNGQVYIYDSNVGKLLVTTKLPLNLIDTLKYHFKKNMLYQDKINNIYSVEDLLDLTSKNPNIKESERFEKTNEYYIRNIQKSIIVDDSIIYHLVRTRFLFKENILDSIQYLQEISIIVKMVDNKIKSCFFPDIILDDNNDPHFPLYSDFILDNNSDDSYFLNVFNEYYNFYKNGIRVNKFNYTTALQSSDYNKKQLLALLPEKLIQNKVYYNFSYPHYVNLNSKIYYGFQLIDSIYELSSSKSFKLDINSSNEYFFQNYSTDIIDNSNITRIGFVIKCLSKNSSNNLCVATQIFENYKIDSARATHYLFQEYNSKDFSLVKSLLIPYQYKIEGDDLYNVMLIKANPYKKDEFLIVYKNEENYFIDFCKW